MTIAPPMISAAMDTEANPLDIRTLYSKKYLLHPGPLAFSYPERVSRVPGESEHKDVSQGRDPPNCSEEF